MSANEILCPDCGHSYRNHCFVESGGCDVWDCPCNLNEKNSIWKFIEQDRASVRRAALLEAAEFHPRAMKLIAKRKNFIVIAEDEPYFFEAYGLIRAHEMTKGTWTDEDEKILNVCLEAQEQAQGEGGGQ